MESKYIVFDIETTGLDSTRSRITCICAKSNNGSSYNGCHTNERGLIKDFLKWVKKEKINLLISANGKDFDIPFIFMRAYIKKLETKQVLFLNKYKHFDIINDITDKKISLNNLAKIYGFALKTGDGKEAIKLFQEGKFDKLIDYCMNDVELTEKIYLKYQEIHNE